MLRFIAVLIPIVFALLGITGGKWLESFAFALSVAVGLMPEMLPMVITACLARGSLTTVSYTHLDVYKRQQEGCIIMPKR